MMEYVVLFFLVLGAVFIFIASIGLMKMPDVYLRMSASTIAGTFGVASMLIAVAIHFASFYTALHIFGVIIFLILTVPIGAHMLGRTSHIIGLKMWNKTVCDDLKGKYNDETADFSGQSAEENQNENQNEEDK